MQSAELSLQRPTVDTDVILSLLGILNPALSTSPAGFPGLVPAKGAVGVDDTQRVEGRVHHLPGTQKVHHHRNAQTANQNP